MCSVNPTPKVLWWSPPPPPPPGLTDPQRKSVSRGTKVSVTCRQISTLKERERAGNKPSLFLLKQSCVCRLPLDWSHPGGPSSAWPPRRRVLNRSNGRCTLIGARNFSHTHTQTCASLTRLQKRNSVNCYLDVSPPMKVCWKVTAVVVKPASASC